MLNLGMRLQGSTTWYVRRAPPSVINSSKAPGLMLRPNLRWLDSVLTGYSLCQPAQSRNQELATGIVLVTNNLIVENYNFLSWVYQRWPQNSL